MLLLKKNGVEIDSAKRLVRRDEVATVARAEEIIASAEKLAVTIEEEAKRAFEQERVRGYERGIEEAKAKILEQKLDLVNESINYMQSVESAMGGIVMKALRKCVDDVGDDEMTVQVVRKSMAAIVRSQQQVTVRVPVDKVQLVKGRVNEILKDFPSVTFLEVVEHPRLTGAACVVETAAGVVENTIDAQLAAIERAIRKHFSNG